MQAAIDEYEISEIEVMAIRNDDWLRIQDEIRAATLRPEVYGFRRFLQWLRDWSLVGPSIAAFIALLGITFGAIYYSVANVKEETAFRTGTTIKLGGFDTRLGNIDTRLDKIDSALALLQGQFATLKYANLPKTQLKTYQKELTSVKNGLASAGKDAPGYWPVSFEVIELLSKSLSGIEPNSRPETTLDDISGFTPQTVKLPPGTRYVLKNKISNSVFQDAVVRFDPSVQLENVTFINCVLILPIQINPPPNIQRIGESLLASDLSKVTVRGS